MTEITKIISELYRKLTKEKLTEYENLYKVNKVKFEKEKGF